MKKHSLLFTFLAFLAIPALLASCGDDPINLEADNTYRVLQETLLEAIRECAASGDERCPSTEIYVPPLPGNSSSSEWYNPCPGCSSSSGGSSGGSSGSGSGSSSSGSGSGSSSSSGSQSSNPLPQGNLELNTVYTLDNNCPNTDRLIIQCGWNSETDPKGCCVKIGSTTYSGEHNASCFATNPAAGTTVQLTRQFGYGGVQVRCQYYQPDNPPDCSTTCNW